MLHWTRVLNLKGTAPKAAPTRDNGAGATRELTYLGLAIGLVRRSVDVCNVVVSVALGADPAAKALLYENVLSEEEVEDGAEE